MPTVTQKIQTQYKQTEIGKIPFDWNTKKFVDVTKIITCGLAATPKYVAESVGRPFLSAQNVQNGKVVYDKYRFIPKELFEQITRHNKPQKGDLLYTRVGAGIGEAGVVEDNFEFGIYVSLTLIRTDERQLNNYFLLYLLNSPKFKFFAKNGQFAGGGVQNLNVQVVREFLIPLPSVKEQTAIAGALYDVDVLIEKIERLIEKKKHIKQGMMQELLTGNRRLLGFRGKWELKTIEELEKTGDIELSRGKVISQRDVDNFFGNYPIYSSSIHNDGEFGRYGLYMFDEELITWSIDGGGNFFYRPKHKFSVTNVCGFMRVNVERLNYQFLAAQLQLLHSNLFFDYTMKAHPSVIRKAYSITIPSLSEQISIANVLSDMDIEIKKLESKLIKYQNIKQGMMQTLLTGKIRLPIK